MKFLSKLFASYEDLFIKHLSLKFWSLNDGQSRNCYQALQTSKNCETRHRKSILIVNKSTLVIDQILPLHSKLSLTTTEPLKSPKNIVMLELLFCCPRKTRFFLKTFFFTLHLSWEKRFFY